MPNWCENDLTVEGKIARLKEFQEKMRGKDRHGEETHLNEDALIPYPEEFRKMDEAAAQYLKEHPDDWKNAPKDGFNSGGYEWCIENWGTKWGFCRVQEPELQSYGDGSKMIGMFGMGNPEAKWGVLAIAPLDGPEPDWKALER